MKSESQPKTRYTSYHLKIAYPASNFPTDFQGCESEILIDSEHVPKVTFSLYEKFYRHEI